MNVVGQVAVTHALLHLLRKARGRIVNIGAVNGRSSLPILGPYSASKFAMEAVTDALRVELRPWEIRVSVVEPGDMATPIWEKSVVAADEWLKTLPKEAVDLNGPPITAAREWALKAPKVGMPAEVVASDMVHALTSKRPRNRYLLGRDARLQLILEFLPDRVRDWLISRSVWRQRRS